MKEIIFGVRELQAHLGLALRTANEGGRVVITSHNRPVAQIVAIDRAPREESAIDRKLRRMVSEGRLTPGKRGPMPKFKPDHARGVVAQLEADRR